MYRDDVCAVCGESLPPDHFYCREHAAGVDDRLHELAAVLRRVRHDAGRLAALLDQVAPETWDYLADDEPDEPAWPPTPAVALHADADDVDVAVADEPGMVDLRLRVPLARLLAALGASLTDDEWERVAAACAQAEGANATH